MACPRPSQPAERRRWRVSFLRTTTLRLIASCITQKRSPETITIEGKSYRMKDQIEEP
jgi:hypothetical protein